jgi:hypothetical protein
MKEDHARDVRWLLSDAQDALQETEKAESTFLVDDLPFASMKGVQLRLGDNASHSLIEKCDHYVSEGLYFIYALADVLRL